MAKDGGIALKKVKNGSNRAEIDQKAQTIDQACFLADFYWWSEGLPLSPLDR